MKNKFILVTLLIMFLSFQASFASINQKNQSLIKDKLDYGIISKEDYIKELAEQKNISVEKSRKIMNQKIDGEQKENYYACRIQTTENISGIKISIETMAIIYINNSFREFISVESEGSASVLTSSSNAYLESIKVKGENIDKLNASLHYSFTLVVKESYSQDMGISLEFFETAAEVGRFTYHRKRIGGYHKEKLYH